MVRFRLHRKGEESTTYNRRVGPSVSPSTLAQPENGRGAFPLCGQVIYFISRSALVTLWLIFQIPIERGKEMGSAVPSGVELMRIRLIEAL